MAELTAIMAKHSDLGTGLRPSELTAELLFKPGGNNRYLLTGTILAAPVLFGPELSDILRRAPQAFQYDGYTFVKVGETHDQQNIMGPGLPMEVTYRETNYERDRIQKEAQRRNDWLSYLERQLIESGKQYA